MGVKGLQTFLEKYPNDIFRWVNIIQMAADYRKIHGDATPIIVVDGNNCLHFWVKEVEWVCGGQWDEYLKILRDFLAAFEKIGVKLVFFFDGLTPINKREEWLSRRRQHIERFKKIFANVKARVPLEPDMFTVPAALTYAIPIALKYVFGATVYCNVDGECDRTIASFAAKHQCMAILAQDSDYIIYPTAPYISMEHLDLKAMRTRIYCQKALCRQLGINQGMLPLFACLVGTDYVSRESLTVFHKSICANNFISGLPRIHTTVRCVVRHIIKYATVPQADLSRYVPEVYFSLGQQNAISLDDFKKGIEVYSLNPTGSSGYIYPGTQERDSGIVESVYDVLLRKVKNGELLPTILNVMCSGREIRTPSLEDVDAAHKLPPCVLVYRPLRQRMYGLIFELKDKYTDKHMFVPHTGAMLPISNTVEEWWVNPRENDHEGKDIVLPISLNLHGCMSSAAVMHDIIMEKDETLNMLNKKWTVFTACLGLTMSYTTFERIPHSYKLLCATLNYLVKTPDVAIELWEVEAFIVQAVHPKFIDSNFHNQLQLLPYHPRAVHLATLFLRGVEALFDLIWFCGKPIGIELCMPWHFFNGKFFHYIYKRMSVGDGRGGECNGDTLTLFQQLRDATLEGINLRTSFPCQTRC